MNATSSLVNHLLVANIPYIPWLQPPLVLTSSQEDPRRLWLGMAHVGAGGYHLFGEGLNAHALCPLAGEPHDVLLEILARISGGFNTSSK